MATIPSYLSWVPKTGTGNAQIKINSVSPYTGRADRSTQVPGKIVGKSNAVTVTVLEKAADEFITPDGLTINVAKGGETIHVTGKSNSKLLTFTWKTNFGIANVTSFKVNGSTTAKSGTAITGDPGATGEYTYDVTVVVPKNETIKARSATLEIKGEGSTVVKTITITQALGDSYLYLNSQGTTTATVLAQAIVAEGLKNVTAGASPMDIKRGIDKAVAKVVESIKAQAETVGDNYDKIEQVATVSANNDPVIGKLIADAMRKVSKDGVITIEEAKGTDTTIGVVEGMQFDRGYLSAYFVTNTEKMAKS